MITRYNIVPSKITGIVERHKNPDGDYVLYQDHEQLEKLWQAQNEDNFQDNQRLNQENRRLFQQIVLMEIGTTDRL